MKSMLCGYSEQEPMSADVRKFDVIVFGAGRPCVTRKIDLLKFGYNFRGSE